MFDKAARRFHSAIQIKRGDHRLAGAAHDGPAGAAAGRFRAGQHQMIPQPNLLADPCARFPAHQGMHPARQRAFIFIGIAQIQGLGHHQRQHPVAQEFQPLIGAF